MLSELNAYWFNFSDKTTQNGELSAQITRIINILLILPTLYLGGLPPRSYFGRPGAVLEWPKAGLGFLEVSSAEC